MSESSDLPPADSGRVFHQSGLTRRQLLRGGAGLAGAVWTLGALGGGPAFAAEPAQGEPRPIPGGTEIEGRTFHFYPPSEPGAGKEPSSVTDFVGRVGIAEVSGQGTAGDGTRLFYDVDIRFMAGHFVDTEGKVRRGSLGFL